MSNTLLVTYPVLVGQVLRQLRKSKGMEQIDFSGKIGISQSTWSRIEQGKTSLTIEQLERASRILGTTSVAVLGQIEAAAKSLKAKGIQVETERSEDDLLKAGLIVVGVAVVVGVIMAVLGKKR